LDKTNVIVTNIINKVTLLPNDSGKIIIKGLDAGEYRMVIKEMGI